MKSSSPSQSRKLEIINEKSTSAKVAAAFLANFRSIIRFNIIVFQNTITLA
jgi:hypothetical protein